MILIDGKWRQIQSQRTRIQHFSKQSETILIPKISMQSCSQQMVIIVRFCRIQTTIRFTHVAIPKTAAKRQQPVISQMNAFDGIKKISFMIRLLKIAKAEIKSGRCGQCRRRIRVHLRLVSLNTTSPIQERKITGGCCRLTESTRAWRRCDRRCFRPVKLIFRHGIFISQSLVINACKNKASSSK